MTTKHTWNYFNGDMHGPKPMTLAYCAVCGPSHIPNFDHNPTTPGAGHYGTGFRCAPWRIGRPCDGCGKNI